MTSRRDQAQAQSYVLGRLNAALVIGDPEAQEGPHRRILVGAVGGLLVAALVVAGFTVYGLLVPGGATAWRKAETLIVEKETGSRYIFAGGALRPVRNYASAVLLLGADLKVVSVSAASLRSTPRGMPVGIIGAPDSLPVPGALADTAWSVCALLGRDRNGAPAPATALTVTRSPPGRRPLADDRGLLTRTPADQTFLVWRSHRFAVTEDWIPGAMGYDAPPLLVEPGWLDQLAAGPDIGPPAVPERGESGPEADGVATRIGQVFVTRAIGSGDNRYYLLLEDGLSRLTATAAALVLADPRTAEAYGSKPVTPIELTPAAVTGLPKSKRSALPAGVPETPPRLASGPGDTWCVRRTVPDQSVEVTAGPLPSGLQLTRDGPGVARTGQTAEAVAVAAGAGGVVRPGRPGQAPGSQLFLVTDAGVSYPIANPEVAEAMGYPPTDAATIPPELLALLPTGPALDPNAARG